MATVGQCMFCFEVLQASFQNRDPPRLSQVEELYQEYARAQEEREQAGDGESKAQQERNTDSNSSKSSKNAPSPNSGDSSGASHTSSSTSLSSVPSTSTHAPGKEPSYPVYVTWNTLSRTSGSKHLRGCLGTFEACPLESGLSRFSLASAFEDYRFNPIPSSLLPALACEITLLADFELCADALDWEVGRHGIKISFSDRGRKYGATYLPHVCPEQGWGKEECVLSLMEKGGWQKGGGEGITGSGRRRLLGKGGSGKEGEGRDAKGPWELVTDFKTIRYTGFHSGATHDEWRDWRMWVGKRL